MDSIDAEQVTPDDSAYFAPMPEIFRSKGGGRICPICSKGELDYDSLLNLVCKECGYVESGGFT